MTKSYIVLVILFLLFILVVGAALRRCLPDVKRPRALPQRGGELSTAAVATRESAAGPRESEATDEGEAISSKSGTQALGHSTSPVGIDGLTLRLRRPLPLQGDLRGLATGLGALYAASYTPESGATMVYQLDPKTLAPKQVRRVDDTKYAVPGGMHLEGTLWLSLSPSGDEAGAKTSLVLGLDSATLEVEHYFIVDVSLALVAGRPGGSVLGMSSDGQSVVEWSATGKKMREESISTGAVYRDSTILGDNWICAGHDAEGGVLDVIDLHSLALLSRHRCAGATLSGPIHCDGAFDVFEDESTSDGDMLFYLAIPSDRFPSIESYVLDGVSLQSWLEPQTLGVTVP